MGSIRWTRRVRNNEPFWVSIGPGGEEGSHGVRLQDRTEPGIASVPG